MTFHRNQAQFVHARWRRAVLFPVWAFQMIVLLSILGIFSYRLAETAEHFAADRKAGKVPTVELVWEVTNVGFGVLCLVLTIMEAARLLAETLTPYFLLAAHVIKLTCAAAMLALDIVVYIHRSEGNWSTVGLALDVALLAAMMALLLYAVVTFRRQQAYDDFHHPASNTKAFGYGDGGGNGNNNNYNNGFDDIELRNRNSTSGLVGNSAGMGMASGDVYLRAGPYNDAPAEYNPTPGTGEGGSRSRSHSAASSLRSRQSPLSGGPSATTPGTGAGAVTPDNDGSRRASYNHERDTQFDSYVMNRASTAFSKDDIDHAISRELWGAALPLSSAAGAAGSSSAVERSNSVVATGVVASHHPVMPSTPQRETMNRTVSWSVEPGLVSVPESINEDYEHDGQTLRTVGSVATIAEEYEGHEGHERAGAQNYGARARDEVDEVDDEALAHGRLQTKGANEDRALLMGHSRQGSLDEDEDEDDERGPTPDLAPREP
ncbi:hypothetical protein SCUCBS95973_007380 [Sporothrix curviconia]|uniref:Uncharacterized protein n=1 Tax=Sporothrix curviconia TaxID=1260050 RepID=A0ABP0CFL1_9PEZI